MVHYIGYIALGLNLLSMSMKRMCYLRVLSLLANSLYIIYGSLIDAPPVIIGCTIAVGLHSFHLYKLWRER